jgi:hypothetical protein
MGRVHVQPLVPQPARYMYSYTTQEQGAECSKAKWRFAKTRYGVSDGSNDSAKTETMTWPYADKDGVRRHLVQFIPTFWAFRYEHPSVSANHSIYGTPVTYTMQLYQNTNSLHHQWHARQMPMVTGAHGHTFRDIKNSETFVRIAWLFN